MQAEHYRVLIADDEKAARLRMLDLVSRQPNTEVVGLASNGKEAVELIRSERPDIAFLDIQMPGQDGFKVMEQIGSDAMPLTIFVTAYDQFAVHAFEVQAVDYLLKPISDARFDQAFRRAKEQLKKREDTGGELLPSNAQVETSDSPNYLERIILRVNGTLKLLETEEIDWVEAAGVYVNLHLGPKVYLHRSSIAYLADHLDPNKFIRVNRSALVNTQRVRELRPRTHGEFTLILKDGTELSLNRSYRTRFESWLRQPL
jgi:two-component system, LytTR family, response regulator